MPTFLHYLEESLRNFDFSGKCYSNSPWYARKKAQGRNEKCNCGSGKKYKNCCGK